MSAASARRSLDPAWIPFRHCTDEEYAAFVARMPVVPSFRNRRRRQRQEFMERWPRLDDWLQEPMAVRVGRLEGETQKTPSHPASYNARSYLLYLALTDRLRLDLDWTIAVGQLAVAPVARLLGIDFGVPGLTRHAVRLGFSSTGLAGALHWSLQRIALHHGIRSPESIGMEHIQVLREAVDRFEPVPNLPMLRSATVAEVRRGGLIRLMFLQTLLHHFGNDVPLPLYPARKRAPPPAAQPAMQRAVERWLAERRLTHSSKTTDHEAVSLRHFLDHLAKTAPEVVTFADVTRDHTLGFARAMAENPRTATGRPLSIYARRARLTAIIAFYRDAIERDWPDMPAHPPIDHRDLPKLSKHVPRFIPTDELERLMEAIRALACPFQRAALLTARWSGARRGEIARLAIDSLDRYPDGTPRLRVPAGKTLKDRMVPLHEEAADALRAVIELRGTGPERPMVDERTGEEVHYLFMRRGRPIHVCYLFDVALREACAAAGLVDGHGRHTVTAHRFRHTVGTQLAERGAKLHTIMSVLGHESPHMSMIYARISDAEVLRDYRSVLEPGATIAGAGAEAIRAGRLSQTAVDWLRSNFIKTELELGHCLRLPSEGPCECELFLSCPRFVTTPAYAPRLRERHRLEMTLADDARSRSWPREVERHCATASRIERLLTDLGERFED